MDVPQHPGLAANGRSSMHDDGWASDSYAGPGPLGRDPEVDTAWYGLEECATLAFDRYERLVALCGDLRGPDAARARPRDAAARHAKLPDRPDVEGKRAWENLCAGAYFYLDPQDRAVVATTDGRILEFATSSASGRAELRQERAFDVSGELPADDCLVALMPDWAGLIWFVTQDGRVGTVEPTTGRGEGDRPRRGRLQLPRRRRAGRLRRHRHRALPDVGRPSGKPRADWRSDVRPGWRSRSPASSPAAAAPPRPSSRAAAWRSPTTRTRG